MSDKLPWELLEEAVARADRLPRSTSDPLYLSVTVGWACFLLGLPAFYFLPFTGGALLSLAIQFGFFGLLLRFRGSLLLFAVALLVTVAIAGYVENSLAQEIDRAERDLKKILGQ